MTAPYEWNSMPHVLDIRCPACGRQATFEFAEIVKIAEKKDVPFFQNHRLFEYRFFRTGLPHESWGSPRESFPGLLNFASICFV